MANFMYFDSDFGQWVVCPSFYRFWLPFWYVQTRLNWLCIICGGYLSNILQLTSTLFAIFI